MNGLDLKYIESVFGRDTFVRGMDAYLAGEAGRISRSRLPLGRLVVSGTVDGCRCRAELYDGYALTYCDCRENLSTGRCVHACALLIKYAVSESPDLLRRSLDDEADALIAAYTPALPGETQSKPVTLQPVLSFEDDRPMAAFRIGRERTYIIKGLIAFAERMEKPCMFQYGEAFVFDHDFNAFDDRSKRLVSLVCNYARGLALLIGRKSSAVSEAFGDVRDIPLSGESFDALFDMYRGEKLPCREGGSFVLNERDPENPVDISVISGSLRVRVDEGMTLYDSGSYTYAVFPSLCILRLSPDFASAIRPLAAGSALTRSGLILTPRRAERFCARVLPRLMPYTDSDQLAALQPFMPNELKIRFLLDIPERGLLTAVPNFTYDGTFVECGSPEDAYADVRRDIPREEEALSVLTRWFDAPAPGEYAYTLTDEERMYELLKSGAKDLADLGEVFVSDRLRNVMNGRVPRPVVKARVRGGMLELSLDTDEFPAEELDALMRQVREKRRFYRLKDGSFLDLSDGRFQAFSQAVENLGVKAQGLAKGTALVPLYKAVFLDEALKDDEGVRLEKDADYRRLLRDFKSVEESDFAVPEPLDEVLREYQKTGYRWLRTLDKYGFGGILADDMGLGKTLQVLAFLLALKREGGTGPALIVCPASVAISWGAEIEKWVPELKRCILGGGQAERALQIAAAREYDIIITSYDLMRNDIDLHAKNDYRVCVLDEAQYIKNRETKLFKSVMQLSARTRFALTGTPVENRLSELYNIFDFIMPGYLGTYARFREKYETPISEHGDQAARAALSKLVRPFILRRMKKDVLTELPPKTETNCYIQMGDRQRKLYLAYAAEVKRRMESSQASDKLLILSMLTRLRQICCDPALCVEGYENDSCKLDECAGMVKELIDNGHRILVFSQFTTMLSRIGQRLSEEGVPFFTLQGDTPVDERARLVNAFNAGEGSVFLISLRAGGTGLNLNGADTVIHFDPWWNIAAQNQATDRCYRIGQSRAVQVYKLIASDTIEENIVRLQYKKLDLAKVVTDNENGDLSRLSIEELLELLS